MESKTIRPGLPKHKDKLLETRDILSTFLDASLGDQGMRAQLLAIVNLDDFNRGAMLDPIIAQLHDRKAPEALLRFMTSLKDREVAACAKDILESA